MQTIRIARFGHEKGCLCNPPSSQIRLSVSVRKILRIEKIRSGSFIGLIIGGLGSIIRRLIKLIRIK